MAYRFVLLYNANLDRAEHLRKPISGLRKELKKWEDGLNTKKVSVDDAEVYVVCTLVLIPRRLLIPSSWFFTISQKIRNSEFKKHIDAARESSRKTKQGLDPKPCSSDTIEASRSATPAEQPPRGLGNKQLRHKALVEQTVISDSEGEELF